MYKRQALYNHRWNWWGGSSDITVQNSILWADVAHPINVGGPGDPDSPTGEVDVYKRQSHTHPTPDFNVASAIAYCSCQAIKTLETLPDVDSIPNTIDKGQKKWQYAHVDVYKRQDGSFGRFNGDGTV